MKLDQSMFLSCLESDETKRSINNDLQQAIELKLRGTPAYRIQGKTYLGAVPVDLIEEIISQTR